MPRKRRWSVFLSRSEAHTCTNVPLPIIVFAKLLTLLTIVPDPSDLGVGVQLVQTPMTSQMRMMEPLRCMCIPRIILGIHMGPKP